MLPGVMLLEVGANLPCVGVIVGIFLPIVNVIGDEPEDLRERRVSRNHVAKDSLFLLGGEFHPILFIEPIPRSAREQNQLKADPRLIAPAIMRWPAPTILGAIG